MCYFRFSWQVKQLLHIQVSKHCCGIRISNDSTLQTCDFHSRASAFILMATICSKIPSNYFYAFFDFSNNAKQTLSFRFADENCVVPGVCACFPSRVADGFVSFSAPRANPPLAVKGENARAARENMKRARESGAFVARTDYHTLHGENFTRALLRPPMWKLSDGFAHRFIWASGL